MLVALVVALLVVWPSSTSPARAAEVSPPELNLHSLISQTRGATDIPELHLREWLSKIARHHSRRMAERGGIYHSDLARTLAPHRYELAAENVGMGPSLEAVSAEWMDSPPHRDNILNPRWRMTGVGVVRRGGAVWVTQIFYD